MKRIIFVVVFCVFFTIPSVVKANGYYRCDQYDLIKLQKLASNITTTYDYQETFSSTSEYGTIKFKVYIHNLDPRIYLYDTKTKITYSTSNRQIVIDNVLPGTNMTLSVIGNDFGCNGEKLSTIHINIPSYNKFYTDELCETYPKNKLCKKWSLVDLTYEEFRKRLLKSEYDNGTADEDEEKRKTFKDYFVDAIYFLNEYKYPIFGTLIILSIVGIIIVKLSKRKNEFDLK